MIIECNAKLPHYTNDGVVYEWETIEVEIFDSTILELAYEIKKAEKKQEILDE